MFGPNTAYGYFAPGGLAEGLGNLGSALAEAPLKSMQIRAQREAAMRANAIQQARVNLLESRNEALQGHYAEIESQGAAHNKLMEEASGKALDAQKSAGEQAAAKVKAENYWRADQAARADAQLEAGYTQDKMTGRTVPNPVDPKRVEALRQQYLQQSGMLPDEVAPSVSAAMGPTPPVSAGMGAPAPVVSQPAVSTGMGGTPASAVDDLSPQQFQEQAGSPTAPSTAGWTANIPDVIQSRIDKGNTGPVVGGIPLHASRQQVIAANQGGLPAAPPAIGAPAPGPAYPNGLGPQEQAYLSALSPVDQQSFHAAVASGRGDSAVARLRTNMTQAAAPAMSGPSNQENGIGAIGFGGP